MPFWVKPVLHEAQYSACDNGRWYLVRHCVSLAIWTFVVHSPHAQLLLPGMLGGTSVPVPFSIWSGTHCPLNLYKSILNFVILSASATSWGDKFQEFTALCGKKDFFCQY